MEKLWKSFCCFLFVCVCLFFAKIPLFVVSQNSTSQSAISREWVLLLQKSFLSFSQWDSCCSWQKRDDCVLLFPISFYCLRKSKKTGNQQKKSVFSQFVDNEPILWKRPDVESLRAAPTFANSIFLPLSIHLPHLTTKMATFGLFSTHTHTKRHCLCFWKLVLLNHSFMLVLLLHLSPASTICREAEIVVVTTTKSLIDPTPSVFTSKNPRADLVLFEFWNHLRNWLSTNPFGPNQLLFIFLVKQWLVVWVLLFCLLLFPFEPLRKTNWPCWATGWSQKRNHQESFTHKDRFDGTNNIEVYSCDSPTWRTTTSASLYSCSHNSNSSVFPPSLPFPLTWVGIQKTRKDCSNRGKVCLQSWINDATQATLNCAISLQIPDTAMTVQGCWQLNTKTQIQENKAHKKTKKRKGNPFILKIFSKIVQTRTTLWCSVCCEVVGSNLQLVLDVPIYVSLDQNQGRSSTTKQSKPFKQNEWCVEMTHFLFAFWFFLSKQKQQHKANKMITPSPSNLAFIFSRCHNILVHKTFGLPCQQPDRNSISGLFVVWAFPVKPFQLLRLNFSAFLKKVVNLSLKILLLWFWFV